MAKKFTIGLGLTDITEGIKAYPNIVVLEYREGGIMYFTKAVKERNAANNCGESEENVVITDEHTYTLKHTEFAFRFEDSTYYVLEVPFY